MSESGTFAPTRWTLVVQASGADEGARAALSELCAAYYAPVVSFLRSEGREEDPARELAHEFFARVLAGASLGGADPARGRFRSYLLGAVKHFLADMRDRASAEKRGGGIAPVSLEDTASGWVVSTPASPDSERAFDRQWALTIVARALETVQAELEAAGKGGQFEALKPWIAGTGGELSQAGAAASLHMSAGAVKVAIHRLRQRFRESVKLEIAQTVPVADDVEDELRYLAAVLAL
jgi:DNA-directed RNA polymerase specialized sigma24 family protein